MAYAENVQVMRTGKLISISWYDVAPRGVVDESTERHTVDFYARHDVTISTVSKDAVGTGYRGVIRSQALGLNLMFRSEQEQTSARQEILSALAQGIAYTP